MEAKPLLSVSDLKAGSKQLSSVEQKSLSGGSDLFVDRSSLESLEDLYDKHKGNLEYMYVLISLSGYTYDKIPYCYSLGIYSSLR